MPKPGIVVAVLSWEEVLDVLATAVDGPLRGDVEQLRGMYLSLAGLEIAPLTNPDLLNWRNNEGDFNKVVDRATRRLTTQHPLYPMRDWGRDGYFCRYVGPHGADGPMFSIGVRDPFEPHTTPVWLRYHGATPKVRHIHARLRASTYTVVESGGHLWIPISLPLGVDGETIVDEIVAQAEAIDLVVWGGEPPSAASLPK